MNFLQKLLSLICPHGDYVAKIAELEAEKNSLTVSLDNCKRSVERLELDLKDSKAERIKLEEERGQLSARITILEQKLAAVEKQLIAANEQLYKYEEIEKLAKEAEYWNNKHSLVNITYSGRYFPNSKTIMTVPVQLFITAHDPVIVQGIKKAGLEVADPFNCNKDIYNIYKFTRKNPDNPYRYESDDAVIGFPEFWMLPFELRFAKKGDCDDWGNELASYLIAAGVPRFRVRCVAGNCFGYNGGGHLTVYVLGDDLKTWYHINSTTPHSMISEKKLEDFPTSGDSKDLIGIEKVWFSYNDEHGWSDFEGKPADKAALKEAGFEFKKLRKTNGTKLR